MFSPLAQFDIVCLLPIFIFDFEISITNLSLTVMFVITLGITLLYILFFGQLIPRTWQIFLESIFMFIFRLVYQQTGKSGLIYFPFILSLFLFILFLNLFSLLPFSFAVTSHLIWTLLFSLSICLGIFFIGILRHKIKFFKLFVLDVPLVLAPVMIVLEIFSYVLRSFSLSVRLSANILSGHILVHVIADVVSVLCSMKKIIVIFPFALLIAILILELGVAIIQAYIFVTLVSMYLNDSLHLAAH